MELLKEQIDLLIQMMKNPNMAVTAPAWKTAAATLETLETELKRLQALEAQRLS